MNKKTKLIAIIGGSLLVVVLIGILFLGPGNNKNLVEDPNLPEEYWLRVVDTKNASDGFKTATNKFDGYRITVPSDWLVNDAASLPGGLNIYSDPESLGIESFGGALLNVLTVNDIEEIKEFVRDDVEFEEIEINEEKVYKAAYGEFESYNDIDFGRVEVPINNSGTIAYIFRGDKKYYFVRCTVVGEENYNKLLSQCEEQIKTFEIIK